MIVFDTWPHNAADIVQEALREYVGDGDGEDERVLAVHNAQIVANALEVVMRQLEDLIKPTQHGRYAEKDYNDDFNDGVYEAINFLEGLLVTGTGCSDA